MATFLTPRQKQILEFIESYLAENGVAPTLREIRQRFGYSSYGTVHKHLKLLQEKGYLRRHWNQKRGLELAGGEDEERVGGVELPFFGLIAAGRPIEALPGDDAVGVPDHLLAGSSQEHYVLRVVGDSMIDEGIHDGDLVVVLKRDAARSGEMVVALVGNEATLKRYYPEGQSVRLQPANARMEPMRVPASDVQVQGVVVGLMRRF